MDVNGKVFDVGAFRDMLEQQLSANRSVIDNPLPPGDGSYAVPHVDTFMGQTTTGINIKSYLISDTALKEAWMNAEYMRNDLCVMECLEIRKRTTALLKWHIRCRNPKDERQREAARTIQEIIEDIPRFTQFKDCLLDALWYGRSGVQLQWRNRFIDEQKQIYIHSWIPINGDKLVFAVQEGRPYEDEKVGIRVGGAVYANNTLSPEQVEQLEPTDNGEAYYFTPEERDLIVVHKHFIEDGDYRDPRSGGKINGVGIRSRIYWTWYLMKEVTNGLMEFIDRSANGFEIWYYPMGNKEAQQATEKAALNRTGNGRNTVLVPRPIGEDSALYDVRRIEPSMGGVDACMRVIQELFAHQIKRYIIGQTLTTESSSTGLGSNLANVHMETFLQIIKYDALNLQESLTKEIVAKIAKFNFPDINPINFQFIIETEEPDKKGKLEAARTAYNMGVRIAEEEVLDAAGLSPVGPNDHVLENPQIAHFSDMVTSLKGDKNHGVKDDKKEYVAPQTAARRFQGLPPNDNITSRRSNTGLPRNIDIRQVFDH